VGSFYADLAATLVATGHRVWVVTAGPSDAPDADPSPNGYVVHRVRVADRRTDWLTPANRWDRWALAAESVVASLVRTESIEIVEASNTEGGALGLRATLDPSIPLVIRVHGFVSDPPIDPEDRLRARALLDAGTPAWKRLARPFLRSWKRRTGRAAEFGVLREADAVIVPSDSIGRLVASAVTAGQPPVLVPHRVDVNVISRSLEASRGLPNPVLASLPAGVPYVVAAGRISRAKGSAVLLEAILGARAVIPELRLVMVGPARDLDLVRALPDYVTLTGRVPRATVWRLMAESAAVVHPSLYEASGMVIGEALACGTPVVAFRTGPMPELIEDGVSGRLVRFGDVAGLGAAIAAVASDATMRAHTRAQAQLATGGHGDADASLRGTTSAYASAFERRRTVVAAPALRGGPPESASPGVSA
jgi:glycosyltransferase involved in cell wall biosynthesis